MAEPPKTVGDKENGVHYIQYSGDKEASYLPAIRQLISKDLSEPYSIYVYRYFLYQWGELCFMVRSPLRASSGECPLLTSAP